MRSIGALGGVTGKGGLLLLGPKELPEITSWAASQAAGSLLEDRLREAQSRSLDPSVPPGLESKEQPGPARNSCLLRPGARLSWPIPPPLAVVVPCWPLQLVSLLGPQALVSAVAVLTQGCPSLPSKILES